MSCVTWYCKKCKTYFKGNWLTRKCPSCGNYHFNNRYGIDGTILLNNIIVTAKHITVWKEEVLQTSNQ